MKRGDVYFADLGSDTTSSIQCGLRPVLVVSNDKANKYSQAVTVVPITGRVRKKRYLPTHVFIPKTSGSGLAHPGLALAEQVITLDKRQFKNYRGHIKDLKIMDAVTWALKVQIGAVGRTR